MSDPISAQALFQAGLTREQFIQKYSEIQKNSGDKNSSIFTEDFANSLGQIFDTLNTNGNDTLDDTEITTLQGLGDNDDSTLSEADLKALYTKMGNEIISKNNTSSEQVQNAMTDGEAYSNTYLQDLHQQISVLEELVSLRRINSTNIQQSYQSQIDDIIKKNLQLTTEQKIEYIKLSEELSAIQKEADKTAVKMKQLESQIKNKDNEIKLTQAEIDKMNSNEEENSQSLAVWTNDLNRLLSEKDDLNYQYQTLSIKQQQLNRQKTTKKNALDEKNREICSGNPELTQKIALYNNLIEQEQRNSESEIQNYESHISQLRNNQAQAIEQMRNRPVSTPSIANSHQNDNLMSFKELESMGLKYSGAKGQKLAGTIQKHLKGFTGYCSRHVSNALAESGLGNERCASAADMDSKLVNNRNFKEIKISNVNDLKQLPAGCILVYERGAARYNSKHGHIEVTLGDGTAGSDGRTRNLRYTENMHVFVPVEQAA